MKEQLEAGKSPDEVSIDVRMSVIKEVAACWLVSLYDYPLNHPDISKNGIAKAISNISQLELAEEDDRFSTLTDCDSD